MKNSILKAGVIYFLVVLIGFLIDLGIFYLLVDWGVGVVASNSLAFLVGASCNALLIRAVAFESNRFSVGADLALTLIISAAVFAAGTALLAWLVKSFGTSPITAKLVTNLITLVINFSIRATLFARS